MRTRKLRFLSALLAVAMMFVMMPVGAFADDTIPTLPALEENEFDYNGIRYKKLTGTEVSVVGPVRFQQDLDSERVIPAAVKDSDGKSYTVTEIGDNAFNCYNGALKDYVGRPYFVSVSIPNTVERIGKNAFLQCTDWSQYWEDNGDNTHTIHENVGLQHIIFENGSRLRIIDEGAFAGCYTLQEIEIPSSVERIEEQAFFDDASIKSFTFQEGSQLTYIGKTAFHWLNGVKSIKLPDTVETIEEEAFFNCTNLESIELPKSINKIGSKAFSQCSKLEKVIYDGTPEEWEAITNGGAFDDPEGSNETVNNPANLVYLFTVTFDANGHGTAPASQRVYKGEALEPTAEPTDSNYKFDGWYTDKECTNAFAIDTPIEQSMTLYAKWERKATPIAPASAYGVAVENGTAWVKNGEQEEQVTYAKPGQTVTIKANDNIADGMKFDHWEIRKGKVELADGHAAETTFTMPTEPVELAVMLTTENDDSGWDVGTVVTTAVLGAGVAYLGYQVGTELYAKQILGDGVAIPRTRADVALTAWQLAGKPEVAIEGEPLSEAAQAQKWAVESGLMQNVDGSFNPEKKMSKLKALKVLDAAKKMG